MGVDQSELAGLPKQWAAQEDPLCGLEGGERKQLLSGVTSNRGRQHQPGQLLIPMRQGLRSWKGGSRVREQWWNKVQAVS